MRQRTRRAGIALAATSVIVVAAACGSSSSGSGGSTSSGKSAAKGTVIMGTTDTIVSADPAGSYDLPSWTIIYNVYQTLLSVPPGTSNIQPDAANCSFTNSTTYVCTLKPNQEFSNGDPVTGADVAYSFNRVVKIKSPAGPASLLAPMKSVTANGNTVTFTLSAPDATWPYVLTTAAGAIVDSKVFPATKLLPDAQIIGSGPYKLASYTKNQLAEFVPNPHYGGSDVLHNSKFIVKYEQDASTLVSDTEQKSVDIAYRTLSPTDLQALKNKGVALDEGKGIEMRYLVFNQNLAPEAGRTAAQKLAIRQAFAYLVDRNSIAKNVYKSTVQPLYSVIPQGLTGANTAYQNDYGTAPDPSKAKAVLTAAGIKTPVPITLWYNVNHYDDTDLATELQRELSASGLFTVKLQTAEWATYQNAALTNQYGVFLFGWFPDYPDADDYTGPFFPCKTSFLNDHYCNPNVDKLIAAEEKSSNTSKRTQDFDSMQTLLAKDVPTLPIWQGGQVAAVNSGVSGVQSTLDPSYTFRFWLIGKS